MKMRIILLLFAGWLISLFACSGDTSKNQMDLSESAKQAYLEKGQNIAAATFAVLGGQLQKALAEGGVPNAIQYCNTVAYPLVDSLSNVHRASIRRTSLKVRNPNNKPTPSELLVLKEYEKGAKSKEELKPIVRELENGDVAFYAPIKIQGLCLTCHGKLGENLSEKDYEVIKKYYPRDDAVGYESGALRGMWSIQLNKPLKK